jgi:hypothetical protein
LEIFLKSAMKTALKRKSPDRELDNCCKGKKDLRVSEQDAQEKRRLRAERKAAGSPDYQVSIFADLERGLPPILEEFEDMEVTRLLAEMPPPSQLPPAMSEEEMSKDEEEWTTVQRRAAPRQVPQGGRGVERAKGTNLPGTVESGEILKSPRSRRLTTGRPEAVETVETGKGTAATPRPGGLAPTPVPLQLLPLSWSSGSMRARPQRCPSSLRLSPPSKRPWAQH